MWQRNLPEGTAELNGFTAGEPTWELSGDVLLVATPKEILAINIETGENQWSVSTSVESWEADEQALVVTTDGGLSILPFPDAAETSGADSDDDLDAGPTLLGSYEDTDVPVFEDFQDATLAIPAECEAVSGVSGPVTFEQGLAEGSDPQDLVAMTAFTQVVSEGSIYSVVSLNCDLFAEEETPPYLAVYDIDMELLGGADYLAASPDPDGEVQDVYSVGSALNVVQGDEVISMIWDGQAFTAASVGPQDEVAIPDWERQTLEIVGREPLTEDEVLNGTIFFPAGVLGTNPDEYITFVDGTASSGSSYRDHVRTMRAQIYTGHGPAVPITVGGQSFLLVSLGYKPAGYDGELIEGGLCAINSDAVCVACTGAYGNSNVTVDGDIVTYLGFWGSDGIDNGEIVERFDGKRFTPLRWHIQNSITGEVADTGGEGDPAPQWLRNTSMYD